MTVSVSNDDDDEEDKRFAFSLSFVMTRCMRAAREFIDQSFHRYIVSAPEIPCPRITPARVRSELICR